jgi:hypothetical protein
VVDDQVGHDLVRSRKVANIRPSAKTLIDFGVISWVESGVAAIEGRVEREHMNAGERARKRPPKQRGQTRDRSSESIRVGD